MSSGTDQEGPDKEGAGGTINTMILPDSQRWQIIETCKILKQERLTAPQIFLELFQAIRQEYSLVFKLCYNRIEEQVIYHTL